MSALNATYDFKGVETNYKLGTPIDFILTIRPRENIDFKTLTCQIIAETRGLLPRTNETVSDFNIVINDTLRNGQIYEFPVTLKNNHSVTYNGVSVSKSLVLQTIEVRSDKVSFLDKVKKVFVEPVPLISRSITFETNPSDYKVVESTYKLKSKFGSGCLKLLSYFFTFLLMGYLAMTFFYPSEAKKIWVKLPEHSLGFLIGAVLLVVLIVLMIHFILEWKVGKSTIRLFNTEGDQFEVSVHNEKDWEHSAELNVSFKVVEVVEDDRGTSTTYHRKPIHQSLSIPIKTPRNGSKVAFSFPDFSIPRPGEIPNTTFIPTISVEKITKLFGIRNYTTIIEIVQLEAKKMSGNYDR